MKIINLKKILGLSCLLLATQASLATLTLSSELFNEGGSYDDNLTVEYKNCTIDKQGVVNCGEIQSKTGIPVNQDATIQNKSDTAEKVYTIIKSAQIGDAKTTYSLNPNDPNACVSPTTNISMYYRFNFVAGGKVVYCNNIGESH